MVSPCVPPMKHPRLLTMAALAWFLTLASSDAAILFTNRSPWKYQLGTTEASSPTDAWRALAFNDAAWATGPSPIGYGVADIATAVPTSSAGGYTTIYLRKAVLIPDPATISQLELAMRIDDGAVIWINGVEVGRFNAPAGALAYNAFASTAPSLWTSNRVVLNATSSPPLASVLQAGTNLFAVHLLNGTVGSSDILFDADALTVEPDPIPPTLLSVSPGAGTTLNQLTSVVVGFSEPLSGLDASDLRVNGTPATGVSAVGTTYTFTFPQPAVGAVAFTWDPTHGITDQAIPPNPFNATAPGATWSYTLVDNIPPTVASILPQIAAALPSLGEVQISFSEAVTGVQAADLLINGSPATNLVVVSPTLHVFRFAQPAPGTVTMAWAPGHGITDLASPANAFSGGTWTYTLDPSASLATLVITEFMASNTRTLPDEDGAYEDWIEIHNPGAVPVDLAGWSLTDSASDLRKWIFPATNLAAGAYTYVFASTKDRRIPGRVLHTNFRLSGSGEYLGLVRPDGTNITSQFAPVFPVQYADVSYGLQQNASTVTLVNTAATGRVLVPTNDALGLNWTQPGFADSGWLAATNGIGFETSPGEPGETPYGSLIRTDIRTAMHTRNPAAYVRFPFQVADPTAVNSLSLQVRYDDGFAAYLNGRLLATRNAPVTYTVADSSLDFSGVHGQDNWFYGYYNQSTDTATPGYQTNDFIAFPRDGTTTLSAGNYWMGTAWDWYAGNPPWDYLDATGGHPNGSNSGQVHWAVRRWRAEVAGTLRLTLRYAKSNTGGGNGTTGRAFRNGTQVWSQTVGGTDGVGVNVTLTISNVAVGDLLDFAIDPLGTDTTQADSADGTLFTISIDAIAPDLVHNSAALTVRSNALGREFEPISLPNALSWLVPGENILALQALNVHATNADLLIQPIFESTQPLPLTEGVGRYFSVPTPGGANGSGVQNLGPIIAETTHSPAEPLDGEDLVVLARITPTIAPLATNVLVYRIMFGSEVTVPLLDNGLNGDGSAGDGVYGARIPASASTPGQMIRWYVLATDTGARQTRWPFYTSTTASPQYLGTIVANPALTNPLPVLHWFIASPTGADSDTGSRASIYYLGKFYDNVYMNLHGQSSRGFPKKSYDVEFNPGYRFTYRPGSPTVSDINWITTYADKAHLRNLLSHEAFAAHGSAHHWVEVVRVQQNASFYGTAHLVENGDEEFISRLGLNPENPLYKMYNTFTTSPTHANLGSGNVEKKSRKYEGSADLQALLNGILLTGEPRRAFIYDNIDVAQMINTMVVRAAVAEQDCCHKNYYFYRDTLGDREWEIWPWDVDLSYGRRYISGPNYWDDNMIWDTRNPVGDNNGLLLALYNTAEIREMYWRRFRTVMDEFLQAPGTPTNQLRIERRLEALVPKISPDALQDLALRGTWCCGAAGPYTQATIPQPTNYQTLRQAVDLMKNGYLPARRGYLFTNRNAVNLEIPNPQPADARVLLATYEANPASGNQEEEYVVLTNSNPYAVDISNWRLDGAVQHTFQTGTVIPANRVLYVSPNINAFRARTTGPRGGLALHVQGNYKGRLSARGETLRIINAAGGLVDYWSYPAAPSAAQNALRITEIMYAPAPLAGNTNSAEEFEYLELRNTGATPLSLLGVRLTNGVSFSFSGSAVTNLPPGAAVLVVRNLSLFQARYGASVPAGTVAGQYEGALDNKGERLTLLDGTGEEILDFEYNNSWYPVTDGLGFSLVVVDTAAQPDAWGNKSQWRPSGQWHGTPGQAEGAPTALPAVLITEALTRSETPPPTDSIELHNPGATPADVGGWFLTDDFNAPQKFRIPAGTLIPAGGHVVFDESQFNPGGLGFGLNSDGDQVWLFSGDAATNLTGYVHGYAFGAADNGVTFGRVVTSDGREHFVAQTSPSLGAANPGPRIGPVVISEIHYRPPDRVDDSAGSFTGPVVSDNSSDEFIELFNAGSTNVPLFDPAQPFNTWQVSGGADLAFPLGITLAPGERILVANFNPADAAALAAFRTRFGVDPSVRVFGPYSGKLNNSADDVNLKRPILLPGGIVGFVLVDEVEYSDGNAWPQGADGYGYSLQRWNTAGFGNEPANWVAASPTPGRATSTNNPPPTFPVQPASLLVSLGQPAAFTPVAAGAGPISFQWLFNGQSLPGATNLTLQIAAASLAQAGEYNLLAWNSGGLSVSATATLNIGIPPTITQAPTNILVRIPPDPAAAPTTNATFTVSAFSRSLLSYQWRSNGVDIPGATGSSLTITNVRTNHTACFSVVISDGASFLQSTAACLYPLVAIGSPLQGPLPQIVTPGSPVTLSAEYTGWPPPYTVIWQIGSAGQVTNSENRTATFHSFNATNVAGITQQWRVIVRNLATPGGRVSTFAPIITTTDSDSDGLPDSWEATYGAAFGGSLDPLGDADADGASNYNEFIAGTDPTNATSVLEVESFSFTNGVRLELNILSNRTYQVLRSPAAAGAPWTSIADFTARPTNRTEVVRDPLSGTNGYYYRIATPRRP
ncbi:MAG: hypothetical protein RJA22_2248 [Verrucomicrobiota bacterium]